MRLFVRSYLTRILAIANVAYWSMELTIPNVISIDLVNSITASIGLGVLVAFLPIFWEAIRRRNFDSGDVLSIGIFLIVLGTVWGRVVGLLWRFWDQPMDMLDSAWASYGIFIGGFGCALVLMTPGEIKGRIPQPEWVRIGIWAAIGMLIFCLMFIYLNHTGKIGS